MIASLTREGPVSLGRCLPRRQLVEAMDQGLQRQREQYLRLESDMASQDDEAAELRYRNALLGDHVNHLHHALGALHQRRRRHVRPALHGSLSTPER